MVTQDNLNSLAAAAQAAVTPARLADINTILIDSTQPPHARIARFVRDIGNPYIFSTKGTVVRVSYTDGGPPLARLLEKVARIESS